MFMSKNLSFVPYKILVDKQKEQVQRKSREILRLKVQNALSKFLNKSLLCSIEVRSLKQVVPQQPKVQKSN